MKIKKLGHCCLLIEIDGARIMTDPGAWSTAQNDVVGVDIILITHEHQDHLHVGSLQTVLKNNPSAKIFTNTAVGKILSAEGISFTLLEDGGSHTEDAITLEGYGTTHASIYDSLFTPVQNTGYFIQNKFFYPGDAFIVPPKVVDVLALPVCGPWMHIRECIDYAKEIKPRVCFPVHDGMLAIHGPFHMVPKMALEKVGLTFTPMLPGEEKEF